MLTKAAQCVNTKSFWKAGRLYSAISSAAAGLHDEERISYMLKAISCLRSVNKKAQPGALAMLCRTSWRFVLAYSSHEEANRMATELIATAQLDPRDLDAKDMKAPVLARVAAGYIMTGETILH